ncbi:sulfite exporter TauE/SafE family protein [Allohahella marinimesophila]|uniref:Sulfite exporter TauE/SafE family protein n=1 Tax=Allohahella marinimesophila TaxID=1054972 RepID=A0ABP7NMI0_9GAMM
MWTPLIAVGIGLLGSTHCLAMCGGIAGAQSLSSKQSGGASPGARIDLAPVVLFNFSRLLSYALLGLIFGTIGSVLVINMPVLILLRTFAGLLLIAMGLYVGQWWYGLVSLERIGSRLFQPVQRAQKITARPCGEATESRQGARSLWQIIAAGMLWGLLPCGLVYSALAWSFSQADGPQAALLMFCFGLGTLPSMISAGLLAYHVRRILGRRDVRKAAGCLLVIYGIWTIPLGAIIRMFASTHA